MYRVLYSGYSSLGRTTRSAADCMPRRSPPAAWPASIAARSRVASSPGVERYARSISATTASPVRMFP